MTESKALATVGIPTFTDQQLRIIKDTVASDCNMEEFNLFMEICKMTGLNPFKKHIYAFVFKKTRKRKIDGKWKEVEERSLTPVTGIDGYRSIAQRSGTYRPADTEPQFVMDETKIGSDINPEGIVKCVVQVYIWGQDKQYHPVIGTARWSEYAPIVNKGHWGIPEGKQYKEFIPAADGARHLDPKKPNWKKMPFIMLGKCAEAQALRKGWEMGGVYERSEIDNADTEQRTAGEQLEAHEEAKRNARVAPKDSINIMLSDSDGLQKIPFGQFYDKVMEHIGLFEDMRMLKTWRENQAAGLQDFWVKQPTEALVLRQQIEDKITALEKAQRAQPEQEPSHVVADDQDLNRDTDGA